MSTQLTRRIIPCLDVKDGRVVKGVQFQGLRDAGDPAALAGAYEAQGADERTGMRGGTWAQVGLERIVVAPFAEVRLLRRCRLRCRFR